MIRLGLAVDDGCVRAVMIRAGKAVWARESIVESLDQLSAAVTSLLRTAPLPRLQRARVNVAIGPMHSQVRRINGLPSTTDAALLARVVHQGLVSFFMKSDRPVLATNVRAIEPGSVWACVIDAATVRAIVAGCRAAHVRLALVAPGAAVVGHALEDDQVCWRSSHCHLHLEFADCELASLRRLRSAAEEGCVGPNAKAALNSVVVDASRFVDACGAALAPRTLPLSLDRSLLIEHNARSARWRLAVAGAAFVTAAGSALLAPTMAATRAGRNAERVITTLATEKGLADTIHRDVTRITSAINDVAEFAARRHPVTLLLRELAGALPERTALANLRVDSTGGTIVALGPQAARIVAALEQVALIASPQITGPITRELLGTETVERVTVQFRLAGSIATGAREQPE